jgi:hypothetical protein
MVKRYGNLYPQVVAFENLYRAYRKAAKGKRGQANVADFEFDLAHNLLTLQARLFYSLMLRAPVPGAVDARLGR